MQSLTAFLDFFLPRFCPSCKSKLSLDDKFICHDCLSKIKLADKQRIQHEYDRKFYKEGIILEFISLFVFEKDKELQNVIHELKYNGKFGLGIFLGKLFAQRFRDKMDELTIDVIIPVPLHHLKQAERGYNQSEYIAKGISSLTGIPTKSKLIRRIKFTETQTELSLLERKKNIHDAFKLRGKQNLNDKNIILIDDVITTGATISECGRILKRAGAKKIFAGSIAIAD
jgi:ComF family protein